MKKGVFLAFLFFLSFNILRAQVALFPTAAFIDPATKTGSMQVINTSDEVREFEISFKFGFFTYDSLGNSFTQFSDSVAEKEYSLVPYIRVFPQKLLIPPKEQQTIRFMLRNMPQNMEDKFYWARVVATSVPKTPQVDTIQKGQVKAALIIKMEMVGLVGYLKGKNTSDLDYNFITQTTDTANVNLLLKNDKKGKVPFWGTMLTEIYDSSDKLIDEKKESMAIYFSCNQKLPFPKEKLPPGKYKAKITVNNEREEIPEEFRSAFKPKTKTFDFEVK